MRLTEVFKTFALTVFAFQFAFAGALGGAADDRLQVHTFCQEHGEWVHADEVPAAPSHEKGVPTKAHHHCAIFGAVLNRDATELSPAAVVARSPAIPSAYIPPSSRPRAPVVGRYRLAPKNSPPTTFI